MSTRINRRVQPQRISRAAASVTLAILMTGLIGCPFGELPSSTVSSETELVSVTATTAVETPLHAGAPSLVNSTWAIYKSSDDSLLFRLAFGPEGELVRLFDSFVLAQPWLGSEVIPDAQAHATAFAGGRYVFGAYIVEQDDRIGVLGVIHGVLLGAHLGTARVSFSGAVDDERVDGVFVRRATILADTPFPPPGDAQFDAYALRER